MTKSTPKSTIISCVYDILGDSQISKWYNDGTIEVARPTVNVNLENIKFRSFSANIKSDIQNLTSPNINAKLCGNFTWYKNQKQTINPPSGASSDVIEGTEIPITPYVQDLRVTLYNQGGVQQYEAANGLYHNDINNDIVFTEFNVPLVTSFQDSVNDMLKYAKYNLTRLLGLYNNDKAFNKNIYDTSTFVYGEVNLKPYISELGGNKWTNAPCQFVTNTTSPYASVYGLTYKEGTQDPTLTYGGITYATDKLMNPSFADVSQEVGTPYGFFRKFRTLRNADNETFTVGVRTTQSKVPKVTPTNPWSDVSINVLTNPFDFSLMQDFRPKCNNNGTTYLGSTLQNGKKWVTTYFYKFEENEYTSISDIKKSLLFGSIYDPIEPIIPYIYFMIAYCEQEDTLPSKLGIKDFQTNNRDNETMQLMMDNGYYFISSYFYSENSILGEDKKMHLFLVFANYEDIRVFHFKLFDTENGPWTFGPSLVTLPAVDKIYKISLPRGKRFAFIENDWNESNYLEYLQELQNAAVPNAPMFILPKFTDGTNCALLFDCISQYFECNLIGNNLNNAFDNVFYNNSTVYCIRRYEKNEEMKTLISACGPCCAINDSTGSNVTMSSDDIIMFWNYFFIRWGQSISYLESDKFRDISKFVNDYNLQFPIVNALAIPSYPWDSINENNYDLQLANDSIIWLIDSLGHQLYLKDQTFENIYSFAQSSLSVSFTYSEDEAHPNKYIMYPAIPTIGEPSTLSSTTYSWINDKHITSTFANPYFYANDSIYSFIDNTFKVDDNGKITFPCVPVVTKDGSSSGLLTFFVKFETSPAVFTFDPNIKQSDRFANMYNFTKQFINRTPSLYNDKYPFDDYIFYNNKILYDNLTVYLELKNRDLTLKLRCLNYPSPDNVVFYLNETSMVDFKECVIPAIMNHLTLLIIDADGEVLTPQLAKNIYSNINICIDWEFMS